MKSFLATLLLAAGLGVSAPTAAPAADANTPASSPLLGRWAVDVSRLPMPPAARPKSVTLAFADAGGGKWSVNVEIVDAEGAKIRTVSTYPLDGTVATVQGSTIEADTGAMKTPTPNVLVLGLGKAGMPASTRVYTIAADGNSMTETAVSFDGVPVLRTHYFSRVR